MAYLIYIFYKPNGRKRLGHCRFTPRSARVKRKTNTELTQICVYLKIKNKLFTLKNIFYPLIQEISSQVHTKFIEEANIFQTTSYSSYSSVS